MPLSIFREAGKAIATKRESVGGSFALRGYLEPEARGIAKTIINTFEIVLLKGEMQGRLLTESIYKGEERPSRDAIHDIQYDEPTQTARFTLPGEPDFAALEKNLEEMHTQIIRNAHPAHVAGHKGVKDGHYYISLFPKLAPAGKESPMRRHLSRNRPGFLAELAREAVLDSALANRMDDASFVDPDFIHNDQHFAALIVPAGQFEKLKDIERLAA